MGRREMSQILANFIFLCLCTAVSGLYFHIAETEKKCFIEEIPDDTIVVGKFSFWSQIMTGAVATRADVNGRWGVEPAR